jgi:chorismate dehydratase
VPYLNCAPFVRHWEVGEAVEALDCTPRELGRLAAQGAIVAGPLSLVDFFRLEDRFEPLGHFGIAVRGRAHSALLFSRRPIRQLADCRVGVTEETATTGCLLRLILERRYQLSGITYESGTDHEADALLLIGDEALRYRARNTQYPFEIDVAFEWWLWEHRPFVFALWAIRRDASDERKRALTRTLARSLSLSLGEIPAIADEAAGRIGLPAAELRGYLESFVYRLGPDERAGVERFRALVDEHNLL